MIHIKLILKRNVMMGATFFSLLLRNVAGRCVSIYSSDLNAHSDFEFTAISGLFNFSDNLMT